LFFQVNDKIINLKNVSNINVLKNKKRIIFNMNYSIDISVGKQQKTISDYVYWDCVDLNSLNDNITSLIGCKYFYSNFIENGHGGFINTQEISSIKFVKSKKRVIFNLSHPVTFIDSDQKAKITSEFVYCNFNNTEEYSSYVYYLQEALKKKYDEV
jgi:hypothetical protein